MPHAQTSVSKSLSALSEVYHYKTLTPRFTDFLTDFEKKNPTVLQSNENPDSGSRVILLVPKNSGSPEHFAFGIGNLGLWNPEYNPSNPVILRSLKFAVY